MADPVTQNDFGPLTDEQRRLLERGRVTTSTLSPFDILVPGGIGAALGRQAGRGIARIGEATSDMFLPTLSTLAKMGGYNPAATVNAGGRIGATIGGVVGGGLGAIVGPQSRDYANTVRDAEGQPGGYYGQPAPISRDAEGQPGYGLADILQGRGQR